EAGPEHGAVVATHGQGRQFARPEPATFATGRVEGAQAAIVGTHEHQALPDHGRGDYFVGDGGLPAFGAGGRVQCDHFAIEAADHHQAVAGAGTTAQAQVRVVVPDRRAALQVERPHAAIDSRGID